MKSLNYDKIVVIDVECTCDDVDSTFKDRAEIIEHDILCGVHHELFCGCIPDRWRGDPYRRQSGRQQYQIKAESNGKRVVAGSVDELE
jgi:hypothetical protein